MQVRVQPWGGSFENLAGQLQSMLDKMQGGRIFRSHSPHAWCPHLNLYETPERFVVCVELAGMPREDIDVRAADGVLHVCGTRRRPMVADLAAAESQESHASTRGGHTPKDLPVSVHLMEIDSGRFHRKVPLPGDVDVESISATYRHGYLWIALPRRRS